MSYVNQLAWPGWSGALEILVLAVMFYFAIHFFRGTRGAQVLFGFVFLLVALMLVTRLFQLDALNWLLSQFSVYLAVAFLIIFQPEIRGALAELGRRHLFTPSVLDRSVMDSAIQAAHMLAERKIGALIAIERSVSTQAVRETGLRLDAAVTAELLATIFFPYTPLHDGGVIIANDRVAAAACLFPLSQKAEIGKTLGMRHRAAIGLTEESDAVVLVVSEETGAISVAHKGRLIRGLDEEEQRRLLSNLLLKGHGRHTGAVAGEVARGKEKETAGEQHA